MQGKGKQFIPHGQRVSLKFPGGAGYGDVSKRDPELIARDFARGYISEQAARDDYALSDLTIEQIKQAIARGEEV